MFRIRRATEADAERVVEIVNQARLRWSVYFPKPDVELIRKFIWLANNFPEEYCAEVITHNGIVIGGVGLTTEHLTTEFKLCYNALLVVDIKQSPYICGIAVKELLFTAKRYARVMECQRITWTIGTGNWEPFERIISKVLKSSQVGVCINTEV